MEFAKVIERYDPHHNQDHERVRDKLRVHGPIDGLISAQHLRVLACHVSNIASQGANPNFSKPLGCENDDSSDDGEWERLQAEKEEHQRRKEEEEEIERRESEEGVEVGKALRAQLERRRSSTLAGLRQQAEKAAMNEAELQVTYDEPDRST